jgi:hypothetical protein
MVRRRWVRGARGRVVENRSCLAFRTGLSRGVRRAEPLGTDRDPGVASGDATYGGLSRAYVREVKPAVTCGLCASKAPNTSSFSRGGTSK